MARRRYSPTRAVLVRLALEQRDQRSAQEQQRREEQAHDRDGHERADPGREPEHDEREPEGQHERAGATVKKRPGFVAGFTVVGLVPPPVVVVLVDARVRTEVARGSGDHGPAVGDRSRPCRRCRRTAPVVLGASARIAEHRPGRVHVAHAPLGGATSRRHRRCRDDRGGTAGRGAGTHCGSASADASGSTPERLVVGHRPQSGSVERKGDDPGGRRIHRPTDAPPSARGLRPSGARSARAIGARRSSDSPTDVTAPRTSPSTTTLGTLGRQHVGAQMTRPRRCRGTLPPRLSMRATSSWPTKQPLVKLTDRSIDPRPDLGRDRSIRRARGPWPAIPTRSAPTRRPRPRPRPHRAGIGDRRTEQVDRREPGPVVHRDQLGAAGRRRRRRPRRPPPGPAARPSPSRATRSGRRRGGGTASAGRRRPRRTRRRRRSRSRREPRDPSATRRHTRNQASTFPCGWSRNDHAHSPTASGVEVGRHLTLEERHGIGAATRPARRGAPGRRPPHVEGPGSRRSCRSWVRSTPLGSAPGGAALLGHPFRGRNRRQQRPGLVAGLELLVGRHRVGHDAGARPARTPAGRRRDRAGRRSSCGSRSRCRCCPRSPGSRPPRRTGRAWWARGRR